MPGLHGCAGAPDSRWSRRHNCMTFSPAEKHMPLDFCKRRWLALDRWEKIAAVLWCVATLAITMRLLLTPSYQGVYPIFAGAGRSWVAGLDLYQKQAGLDHYRYSPLVAALFAPLASLPDQLGGILWRSMNLLALVIGLGCFCREVVTASLKRAQRGVLFLLVLPLAVGNLHNGQSNLLVLGLILVTLAALAGEHWRLAAGCIALAVLFKLYPAAILLLAVAIFPRRFAGWSLAALAVGLLLPFLLQRPSYVASQYQAWWHHLGDYDRRGASTEYWYRDLRLLAEVCGWHMSDRLYVGIQLGAAAVSAGVCLAARQAGFEKRALLTLLLALGSCWMTVFGPAAESATYVLLAPSRSEERRVGKECSCRWSGCQRYGSE